MQGMDTYILFKATQILQSLVKRTGQLTDAQKALKPRLCEVRVQCCGLALYRALIF